MVAQASDAETLRLLIEIGFGFVSILLAALGGLVSVMLYKIFGGIDAVDAKLTNHIEDDEYQAERTTRLYQHLHIEEIPRRQR